MTTEAVTHAMTYLVGVTTLITMIVGMHLTGGLVCAAVKHEMRRSRPPPRGGLFAVGLVVWLLVAALAAVAALPYWVGRAVLALAAQF